jgi:DNA-3-methyladenine glycosylase
VADRSLARGPGCLGRALGLHADDDGADLLAGGRLALRPGPPLDAPILSGHRVGVSRAHDVPWRFWLAGDPSVSAYKRSPRAAVAP